LETASTTIDGITQPIDGLSIGCKKSAVNIERAAPIAKPIEMYSKIVTVEDPK
jgi:hypothetical protein